MSFLLLLLLLLKDIGAAITNFPNASISMQLLSSANLNTSTTSETCWKMAVTNRQIAHLNTEHLYESWLNGPLGTKVEDKTIGLSSISHFSADYADDLAVVFVKDDLTTQFLVWDLKTDMSLGTSSTYPMAVPNNIIIQNDYCYTIYVNGSAPGISSLYKLKIAGLSVKGAVNTSYLFNNIAQSPDSKTIISWTDYSSIQIYKTANMGYHGAYSVAVTPLSPKTTDQITFSEDSSLAVIQTDSYNPIIVLDIATFTVYKQITINDTIKLAFFLNSSNDYLVVVGQTSTFIVDLANGEQYPVDPLIATSYGSTFDNCIVTCKNNIIEQKKITFTPGTTTDTNTTTIPTTPTDTTPANDPQQIDQSEFYTQLIFSDGQNKAYKAINDSLSVATEATNAISAIASSVPITIYFLSFLNYFTLSSLYVLLNFPIPEHIYKYLSVVYEQINANMLAMIGINLEMSPLSSEKVNRSRALFFGISSDVLSVDTVPFIFFFVNIIAIFLLHFVTSYFRKNNFFRKIFKGRWGMVYGQITNILSAFTIPWTFLMLQAGALNFNTKANSAVFALLYFIGVFFPIFYFFELLQERREKLMIERRKNKPIVEDLKNKLQHHFHPKKRTNKTSRQNKITNSPAGTQIYRPSTAIVKKGEKENNQERKSIQMKYTYQFVRGSRPHKIKDKNIEITKPTIKKQPALTLRSLFTFELAEQWFFCEANFIIPALVLLPNPELFLIAILIFAVIGVVVAFRKTKHRVNSFMLSIYPFCFHACFIVFYWSDSTEVLLVTEIICLGFYLLGSIHHCLFLVFQVFSFFWGAIKSQCNLGKVQPDDQIKAQEKSVSAVNKSEHYSKPQKAEKRPEQELKSGTSNNPKKQLKNLQFSQQKSKKKQNPIAHSSPQALVPLGLVDVSAKILKKRVKKTRMNKPKQSLQVKFSIQDTE